jgi:hypothetical protein
MINLSYVALEPGWPVTGRAATLVYDGGPDAEMASFFGGKNGLQ